MSTIEEPEFRDLYHILKEEAQFMQTYAKKLAILSNALAEHSKDFHKRVDCNFDKYHGGNQHGSN